MTKRVILSAIVGSLIIYGWGFFVYMALPIQKHLSKSFKDDMMVVGAIEANQEGAGVYYYPNCSWNDQISDRDPPLIMINYLPSASYYMSSKPFIWGYVIDFCTALFLALVSLLLKPLRYFARVMSLTFIGFIGVFTVYLNVLNWYGYDYLNVIYRIVIWTLAMFLASLAIAGIMRKKEGDNV